VDLDQEIEEQEEEIQEAGERLRAALTEPVPVTPPLQAPSSRTSDASALMDLLETLVLRVDQVAKTSAEQFNRVESTNQEMNATMELAQEMIAQQDLLVESLASSVAQLGDATAALIKVNANLTQIVAALLAPVQKG
jgi:cytolysin (calcineurin-like family phosphatase)